jgi:hypothetical protein
MSRFTKAVHAVSIKLFGSYVNAAKTERADYEAMIAVLKTVPLNDAEYLKELRGDLFTMFGEAHKDAAQGRVNIINNARRVAFGGMRDDKPIKGKGQAAMLEVCGTVDSIRELRKALAEAVPAALKGASGGNRKSGKGKSAKAQPFRIPATATAVQAFAAAVKVLEFVRTHFVKPSETTETEVINQAIALCDARSK